MQSKKVSTAVKRDKALWMVNVPLAISPHKAIRVPMKSKPRSRNEKSLPMNVWMYSMKNPVMRLAITIKKKRERDCAKP